MDNSGKQAMYSKLRAEGVAFSDSEAAIECLSKCVRPEYLINIYKKEKAKEEVIDVIS